MFSQALPEAPGHIYPLAILRCFWLSMNHESVLPSSLGITYPEYSMPSETAATSATVLDDLIVEAMTDAQLNSLVNALQTEYDNTSRHSSDAVSEFTRYVMKVRAEASIRLTRRLIDALASLIATDQSEAVYQDFLERNPVLVDPLAARIHNRARLGLELITDFVIKRHDTRYIVVEIEKPQDQIFTKSGDFSAQFNHAARQVLDFKGWIASNTAYAQRHLPFIEAPQGLVVMGRRSHINSADADRLRRWCANSRNIDVVTFNDLVDRSTHLLGSLRDTPS